MNIIVWRVTGIFLVRLRSNSEHVGKSLVTDRERSVCERLLVSLEETLSSRFGS